jgi:hypothetical protein
MSFIDEGTPYAVKVARTVWTGEKTEIISNSYLSVFINSNNKYACEYVLSFEREMRKMRAGVYFATQTPEEIIPKDSGSEVADVIRNIFNLCTFKCFFNLDSALLEDIKKFLGNTITDTEIMLLPELEVGQAVVQTSSEDTYMINFDPYPEQIERFDGGQ